MRFGVSARQIKSCTIFQLERRFFHSGYYIHMNICGHNYENGPSQKIEKMFLIIVYNF